MQQLSQVIDDFLRITAKDKSIKAVMKRLSTSDDADQELDAVQESLHVIANNSNEFVSEIHRFSIAPKTDTAQENLRISTANLVRSVELFKNTLTDLHPETVKDDDSLIARLSANEAPDGTEIDMAAQIAHEKVLKLVALEPEELDQVVEEARQRHMSIARRINRFSALLEWESGLLEEA